MNTVRCTRARWMAVVILVGAIFLVTRASCFAETLAECVTTQIKISEVEADPVLSGTDTTDEWFELYNTGVACSMTGWQIVDNGGTWETLPTFNIGANGHVIVAATTNFLTNHPGFSGARVFMADGSIGNGLSNTSDVLRLRDASASEADCMSWGTNTTCLNPAVSQNASNTNATYQRTPSDGTDTNTNVDWMSATETPQGTPTAVTLSAFHARADDERIFWLPLIAIGSGAGVALVIARRKYTQRFSLTRRKK